MFSNTFLTDYLVTREAILGWSEVGLISRIRISGLTMAINVSQKKYRVSRRSLRLSLSPYQPKITFVSRLDTRALRRTTLSAFLSFLLHAIQEHSKIRTSLAKIPLNLIILSPCYLVALLRTLSFYNTRVICLFSFIRTRPFSPSFRISRN